MLRVASAQRQFRYDVGNESSEPWCTPHLATRVGVLAQLHVLPAHQPVQADEHDVQALHAPLRVQKCIQTSADDTRVSVCRAG